MMCIGIILIFMKTIFFKTNNNTNYLFNNLNNYTTIIHPLITSFYNEYVKTGRINYSNYPAYSKDDLEYYEKKFNFFIRHNIISLPNAYNKSNTLTTNILPIQIKQQVANLTQLVFEVTELCNFDCTYCGYGDLYNDYGIRERKNLTFSQIKPFIRQLVKLKKSKLNNNYNRKFYISFYGGEPLLNMNFIKEAVSFFEKTKLDEEIHFSMTTNGWFLNKHIEYFVKHNFHILISLDGNKNGNKYRILHNGQETFEKVYYNAKMIQKIYPEYYKNNINFNAVFTNISNEKSINNFFKENFEKKPTVYPLNDSGIAEDKINDFNEMFKIPKIEDYLDFSPENIRFVNLSKFLRFTLKLEKNSLASLFHNHINKHNPTGTCFPFARKMFITAQGNVLPCERIGHQFSLGNIYSRIDFLDFENIAKQYNKYYEKMINLCSKCYKKDTCSQCMFNLNIEEDRVSCHSFKNESSFRNELTYYISEIEDNPASIKISFETLIIE